MSFIVSDKKRNQYYNEVLLENCKDGLVIYKLNSRLSSFEKYVHL